MANLHNIPQQMLDSTFDSIIQDKMKKISSSTREKLIQALRILWKDIEAKDEGEIAVFVTNFVFRQRWMPEIMEDVILPNMMQSSSQFLSQNSGHLESTEPRTGPSQIKYRNTGEIQPSNVVDYSHSIVNPDPPKKPPKEQERPVFVQEIGSKEKRKVYSLTKLQKKEPFDKSLGWMISSQVPSVQGPILQPEPPKRSSSPGSRK